MRCERSVRKWASSRSMVSFELHKQDGEAARRGGELDGLEQLGEERIGDVADDHAEQPAGSFAQAARGRIGRVTELVDRSPYPRQQHGADLLRIVEDVGDGGHRHLCELGHVADGRHRRPFLKR